MSRTLVVDFVLSLKNCVPTAGQCSHHPAGPFFCVMVQAGGDRGRGKFLVKKNKIKSRSGENKKWKEEMKKSGTMGSWGYPHCNVSTNQCTPVFWVQRRHCENNVAVLKAPKN